MYYVHAFKIITKKSDWQFTIKFTLTLCTLNFAYSSFLYNRHKKEMFYHINLLLSAVYFRASYDINCYANTIIKSYCHHLPTRASDDR